MPKKSVEKTPNKTLELDKKLSAIKGEVNAIIDEEEKELVCLQESEIEPIKQPIKKQPKIIEEIVEEEDPEPVIIRKIIKKKPKQIIEEIEEEEEEPKPKKKDGRGRPRKVQEPEQNDEELLQKKYMSQKQKMQMPQSRHRQEDQQKTYNNRDRFDTILDETNIDLLRQEMRKEMKRRLMSSLFD
jgi:hypothetical protein